MLKPLDRRMQRGWTFKLTSNKLLKILYLAHSCRMAGVKNSLLAAVREMC